MVSLLVMKKFYKTFKINNYTYLFFIMCALCGYLKNVVIIFTICFIHELGHIFLAKFFNYEIISVELFPYGGFTTVNKKINSNINKDIIINCGGIIFQLIFLLIIFVFKKYFNIITYHLYINYNIILIVFNMLPIISLDGNNIIHLILEKYFSYHLSYQINFIISLITLIMFFIVNYIYNIDNYFIIGYLFYKSIMYFKNYKYLKERFLLERYLYDIEYKKIDNNTISINDLKKETLHYFKEKNKYIKERDKIEEKLKKYL